LQLQTLTASELCKKYLADGNVELAAQTLMVSPPGRWASLPAELKQIHIDNMATVTQTAPGGSQDG
jgi:hypothetical protein